MGRFSSKSDLKKIAPILISREEIRKSLRVPLPSKTGGIHKDERRIPRQKQKINLRKGEW